MLEFEIRDQTLVRVDDHTVIARSETLQAHFAFKTDQWQLYLRRNQIQVANYKRL